MAARAQHPGIMQPETAVPVLELYYQRTETPAGRCSTKVVLPENENPAAAGKGRPVLKLYHQSRRRPFQY